MSTVPTWVQVLAGFAPFIGLWAGYFLGRAEGIEHQKHVERMRICCEVLAGCFPDPAEYLREKGEGA